MGVYGAGTANKIVGTGNPPTIVLGNAAGGGGSYTIEGTNVSGSVTITTGAINLSTGGVLFTLTMADGESFPTRIRLHLTAHDINIASMWTRLYVTNETNNSAIVNIAGLALAAATPYTIAYSITGM